MKTNNDFKQLSSINLIKVPDWSKTLSNILIGLIVFTLLILTLTPWVQTSQGVGRVIAFDPNQRVQSISANISGIVNKWFIQEGDTVKKGDPIVEIIDNDPNLVNRLKVERDATAAKLEAAKIARETGYLNYQRQDKLYKEGLSSRTKFEKAKIEYKKLLATEASYRASLTKSEVNLSRQSSQIVYAPHDGTVLRVKPGSGSIFVKSGEVLAHFVPRDVDLAAEIYISGNDLPLIFPGRVVRLQFEGWPAVQFSGWPSIAIGTFGGIVKSVDSSVSSNGKFRVIVVPQNPESWPNERYLRQGARVYGWILLDTVKLGYELWRQFNGFPPSIEVAPEEMDLLKKMDDKNKEETKDYKDYEESKK